MVVKTNIRELERSINRKLNKAAKEVINPVLASQVETQIRRRTLLGFGIDKSGKKEKLKALSEEYKDQRKSQRSFHKKSAGQRRLERNKSRLSTKTTPSKSNLTNTFQMLKGLKGLAKGFGIFIRMEGTRRARQGVKTLTNEQVKDFNELNDRRFFGLATFEITKFSRDIKKKLLAKLK